MAYPLFVPSKSLLVSGVRYLEKLYRSAVSLGAGIWNYISQTRISQDRNQHDLDRDFADEVPGYMRNKEIADVLSRLQLKSGETQIGDNLRRCYEALVTATVFPSAELELVELWLQDLRLAGSKQDGVRQAHL